MSLSSLIRAATRPAHDRIELAFGLPAWICDARSAEALVATAQPPRRTGAGSRA